MANAMRWARFGIGLGLMGYGLYRVARNRDDLFAATAASAGFTLALSGVTNQPVRPVSNLVQHLSGVDVGLAEAAIAALG